MIKFLSLLLITVIIVFAACEENGSDNVIRCNEANSVFTCLIDSVPYIGSTNANTLSKVSMQGSEYLQFDMIISNIFNTQFTFSLIEVRNGISDNCMPEDTSFFMPDSLVCLPSPADTICNLAIATLTRNGLLYTTLFQSAGFIEIDECDDNEIKVSGTFSFLAVGGATGMDSIWIENGVFIDQCYTVLP